MMYNNTVHAHYLLPENIGLYPKTSACTGRRMYRFFAYLGRLLY